MFTYEKVTIGTQNNRNKNRRICYYITKELEHITHQQHAPTLHGYEGNRKINRKYIFF